MSGDSVKHVPQSSLPSGLLWEQSVAPSMKDSEGSHQKLAFYGVDDSTLEVQPAEHQSYNHLRGYTDALRRGLSKCFRDGPLYLPMPAFSQ
jgi:hypothetical protein